MMRLRCRWVKCLAGLAAAGAAGCASPGASKVDVFVTRDDKVVTNRAALPAGETILHIENDDGEAHVVVLARITDPAVTAATLPVVGGTVPTGRAAKQRYDGKGYHVLAKSERLKAYFNGPNRVRTVFHVHLDPGHYVVFANAAGDYERGIRTELTVGS
jgi:hypothetical protein